MDLDLKGRAALVTGASRGIGRAIAHQLAREGCDLVLVARSQDGLLDLAAELSERHNVSVRAYPADLADRHQRVTLAPELEQCDILVNNAGAIPQGDIAVTDSAAALSAWQLKVFGYLDLTRLAVSSMYERERGVILNVVGISGWRPRHDYIAGTMANASLIALIRAVGSVSLDHGVRVVGINPGHTETDRQVERWRHVAADRHGDPDRWREEVAELPAGRLARVDEIAALAAFLCSPRASYISGEVISVDGGLSYRTEAPWKSR